MTWEWDYGDPAHFLAGENEDGLLYAPTRQYENGYQVWRRIKWWKPWHVLRYLNSRRTGKVVFLEMNP